MSQNIFEDIHHLTFISSEACNLNCTYCELAKIATKTHQNENEKIKESFLNGEYVTKYRKFFYDNHIKAEQIEAISLWGQEPTLTLNEFATQMPRILSWLTECNELFFSTNGVAYTERIINLIDIINNYLILHPTREFKLKIQYSIDEIKYMEQQRGTLSLNLINNVKKLITILNEKILADNFTIRLGFHGVFSLKLIHSSLEENSIQDLWLEMDQIVKSFHDSNKNLHVEIPIHWSTAIQHPYNATQAEGKELAEFVKQSINLYDGFQLNALNPYKLLDMYAGWSLSGSDKYSFNDLANIWDMYNYEYDRFCTTDFIGKEFGCGTGRQEIKMRYDGTLIYCQGMIFSLNEKDLDCQSPSITNDIQRLQLKYNYSPNLFTSSNIDILKFIYKFDVKNNYGFNFVVTTIINLMYLLLQCHQIDDSYINNPRKIMRHAMYVAKVSQCWYDHLAETGSLYGRTLGNIRLYCNGFLDLLDDYIQTGAHNELCW